MLKCAVSCGPCAKIVGRWLFHIGLYKDFLRKNSQMCFFCGPVGRWAGGSEDQRANLPMMDKHSVVPQKNEENEGFLRDNEGK